MDILNGIIDPKILKILELFLHNPKQLYHINKVSTDANVPLATTFRIMNNLSELGILKIIKISKLKLYCLDDNKKTRDLRRLL